MVIPRRIVMLAATIAVIHPAAALAQSPLDGFNPAANAAVRAVATQPDGRIIIGGDFTIAAGEARHYLARLNSDGSIDRTFDPAADGPVRAIALEPDGSIVVGGEFTSIAGVLRAMDVN